MEGSNVEILGKPLYCILSDVSYEISELYASFKESTLVSNYLRKSLDTFPSNRRTMLALAKFHMEQKDFNSAQIQCSNMLKLDIDHVEATIMMAHIYCRQKNFNDAMVLLQKLLATKPTQWDALLLLLEVQKRSNNLNKTEFEQYFVASEKFMENSAKNSLSQGNAGYNFCKAMFFKHYCSFKEALKHLTFCRGDREYGEKCIEQTVDILLFPEGNLDDSESVVFDPNAAITIETCQNLVLVYLILI
jgi:Tfp pilus assembly protein PilF